MKNGALPLVLLLAFIFSGCVTSKEHTKKGDLLLFKTANQGADIAHFLDGKFPGEIGALTAQARANAQATANHAKKDPSPGFIKALPAAATGFLNSPASGPLGIVGTLGLSLLAYNRKKKTLSSLVDDLVKTPDKGRCEALRKGII